MLGKALQLAAAGNAGEWPDIDTAYYVRTDVMNINTSIYGITMSEDGTVFYDISLSSNRVRQTTLTTAWDISSHAATSTSIFLPSAATDSTIGITFNADGSTLYATGFVSDTVGEFPLSTNWDISTATLTNNNTLDISNEEGTAWDLEFNANGTALFVIGNSVDKLHKYALSTAYDLSTATFSASTSNVINSSPIGVTFSPTGLKCYILNNVDDRIEQYNLSTPYALADVSGTPDFTRSIAGQTTNPTGFYISHDGEHLYVCSTTQVWQYSLG